MMSNDELEVLHVMLMLGRQVQLPAGAKVVSHEGRVFVVVVSQTVSQKTVYRWRDGETAVSVQAADDDAGITIWLPLDRIKRFSFVPGTRDIYQGPPGG